MRKSVDQSVPIGSDWNTSKSMLDKKEQEFRIANLPPPPPMRPSFEGSPSNATVVRIKLIGNRMKTGFGILFFIWMIHFFVELNHIGVIGAQGDLEILKNHYSECDPDSYFYDLEGCLESVQDDFEAYQRTRVFIVGVQIFAWALIASDLFAISRKLNKFQIVN